MQVLGVLYQPPGILTHGDSKSIERLIL
jgi:hypothetical protein